MDKNEKVIYLMCKWVVPPRRNHNEFNLRKVFYNRMRATNIDQRRILLFKSAFLFLVSGNLKEAIECLKPLCDIDYDKASKLANYTSGKETGFDLFSYLMSNKSFPAFYLVLFFNAMRVRNNDVPIILREDQMKLIIGLLRKSEYNKARSLYCLYLDDSIRKYQIGRAVKRDDLIKRITKKTYELRQLKIKEIHIFGSYARDEATQYSDLDIVVLSNHESLSDEYIFTVEKFLEEKAKTPIDLHIFSNEIDYSKFDKYMIKDMIRIINI